RRRLLDVAPAGRARAELSSRHWRRLDRPRAVSDLGVPRLMNAPPLLTILTLTPLIGALLVIGLGAENRKFARWLSLAFSFVALPLAVCLWRHFDPLSARRHFA